MSQKIFTATLECMSSQQLLSPVEEDRVCKYRFRPDPKGGPEGKPGTFFLDEAVWVYGPIGLYQPGQKYEFTLSTER